MAARTVNILDATELCTLKWLKWYILCHAYCSTVKQNWGLYLLCLCILPFTFLGERKKPKIRACEERRGPRRPGTYQRLSITRLHPPHWWTWFGGRCCRKLSEAGSPDSGLAHLYLPTYLLPTYSSIHASTHPSFSVQYIGPKSLGKTSLKLPREEIVLKTCPSQPRSALCPCLLSSPCVPNLSEARSSWWIKVLYLLEQNIPHCKLIGQWL